MRYVTETDNDLPGSIPATGEWIVSVAPDGFTVCFNNDTGFLKEYDRVALHFHVEGQEEEGSGENGGYRTHLCITGLMSLNGAQPGERIQKSEHPDGADFIDAVSPRIGRAIDGLYENTTEEQRERVWGVAAGIRSNQDILGLLQSVLSGKFTA